MRTLLVHGGAWNIPGDELEPHRKGISGALAAGRKLLEAGKPALDVVEETVAVMEDSGVFDAGKGAILNSERYVELDAAIMAGDLSLGAVASLRHYANPVRVARRVMEKTPHCLLAGLGAEEFAKAQGFAPTRLEKFVSDKERERLKHGVDRPYGTVGALAVDAKGKIAAATSTGGTFGKLPGRIGDSPLVGAGTYADAESGACSCTGLGEAFMKVLAAKTACDLLLTEKSAQAAAEKTIELVKRRGKGNGGIILLGKDGDVGIAFSTPKMARGFWKEGMKDARVDV